MTALDAGQVTVRRVVEVDGVPMSALVREVWEPRGVVVALHGGATTSTYFDVPGLSELSLLRIGAALGFTIIALDRPGYGDSRQALGESAIPAERRVGLAYAAVDRLLENRSRGAGVFLWAHSIGCELAVRMACGERGTDLLGVELAGTGSRYHDSATALSARWEGNRPPRAGFIRDLLWEPAYLYPAEVSGGAAISAPGPDYEGEVANTWVSEFPDRAAEVRVPVHFTLGEFERVWQSGSAALADIASLFVRSPRVVVHEQTTAGHNLSIGVTAVAYHLRVLSFIEECIVGRAL